MGGRNPMGSQLNQKCCSTACRKPWKPPPHAPSWVGATQCTQAFPTQAQVLQHSTQETLSPRKRRQSAEPALEFHKNVQRRHTGSEASTVQGLHNASTEAAQRK
eukprot:1143608-Pelagomonas_calceolata.AAC.2